MISQRKSWNFNKTTIGMVPIISILHRVSVRQFISHHLAIFFFIHFPFIDYHKIKNQILYDNTSLGIKNHVLDVITRHITISFNQNQTLVYIYVLKQINHVSFSRKLIDKSFIIKFINCCEKINIF